jgi:tRNA uridine 5-carboxymethylaminomethyl modification enzyme
MYDVIVVGGGHAGCEAALACANMGFKTLLATGNLNMVGSMPCNPSIGGPAKGVVVREIDALGGYQGKNADMCQIQTKMLNLSKGPAVWALRFQEDKLLYVRQMLKHLKETPNLDLLEGIVEELITENTAIKGVVMEDGQNIPCRAIVVTTGTYLDSRILRGHWTKEEGPDGQKTSKGLSNSLRNLGFEIQRLKTGTPARIKASTIDFSQVSLEPGDDVTWKYSFDDGYDSILNVKVPCYLTHTNQEIHDIIMNNLSESSMYGGVVEGVGPRYCPSIEDKVVRFSDKERHQIFFEPESLELDQEYIQGFSTSMPIEIQDKMIRALPGLKDCEVIVYAYAIEYDAINPLELWPSLETKRVKGLFTAGQINGTSGYEEAAAQGLIAGINACQMLKGEEPLILGRDEAYIGVMIDDLVTKGTKEPYRLLTSRAEYRLLLRHDNADSRLKQIGYDIGLVKEESYQRFIKKLEDVNELTNKLNEVRFTPKSKINEDLKALNLTTLEYGISALELLKRPNVTLELIMPYIEGNYSKEVIESTEINVKYTGYIKKQLETAQKQKELESVKIPNLDYDKIPHLALEARQKLQKVQPSNIGQASRISGVNPSDISVLLIYLKQIIIV